jgi:hypothetical protein
MIYEYTCDALCVQVPHRRRRLSGPSTGDSTAAQHLTTREFFAKKWEIESRPQSRRAVSPTRGRTRHRHGVSKNESTGRRFVGHRAFRDPGRVRLRPSRRGNGRGRSLALPESCNALQEARIAGQRVGRSASMSNGLEPCSVRRDDHCCGHALHPHSFSPAVPGPEAGPGRGSAGRT